MSAIQRFISDSRVVAIFWRKWAGWGKCGENRQNKNRLIRYYQQIKRPFLYPESNKTTCDGGSSVNRTRPDTDNEIIAGGGQATRLLEKLQRYTASGPTPPAGTNPLPPQHAGRDRLRHDGLPTELRHQRHAHGGRASRKTGRRTMDRACDGRAFTYVGNCFYRPKGTCTRAEGKPCRHPDLVRPSPEAYEFDIVRTASELFGLELKWGKEGLLL